MKISHHWLLAWMLMLSIAAGVVRADEPEFAALSDPATCTTTCTKNLCCSSYSGWIADAELTLLTPHTGAFSVTGLPTVLSERDLGVGGRYTLGYRGESGLGLRSRYWHFEQSDSEPAVAALSESLNAQTWDAELTQLFTRGRYVFDLSGGIRWAEIENSVAPLLNDSFDGWGTTLAASGRRQLGNSPWSIVGGARGSLLFGDHTTSILTFPLVSTQEVMPVVETQLGAEYSKCVLGNSHAFLRSGFEAQLWELPPSVLGLLDQNIGFAGVTFAAGLRY